MRAGSITAMTAVGGAPAMPAPAKGPSPNNRSIFLGPECQKYPPIKAYSRAYRSGNLGSSPKIYTDTASGAQTERKGLTEALAFVRPGDTLVVWKLDRLGRSLKDLITRITELNDRKIGFKSLTENIDTTTSGGKLIF